MKLKTLEEIEATSLKNNSPMGFAYVINLRKEAIREIKAFEKRPPVTKELAVVTFDCDEEGIEPGWIYLDKKVIDYIKWKFNITEEDLK